MTTLPPRLFLGTLRFGPTSAENDLCGFWLKAFDISAVPGSISTMTRGQDDVLMIGYAPDAVDFTDPAMPPGLNVVPALEAAAVNMFDVLVQGWDIADAVDRVLPNTG